MSRKIEAFAALKTEQDRWNAFLMQIDAPAAETVLYHNRRLKDEVAHLWAWQVLSVARLSAAIEDREPDFSEIISTPFIPESAAARDAFNEHVFRNYYHKSWEAILLDWQHNFLHFMELAEEIDEETYHDENRFVWMGGLPLLNVLSGSAGHHAEHWKNVATLPHTPKPPQP